MSERANAAANVNALGDDARLSGCLLLWFCLVGLFVCGLTGFIAGYIVHWCKVGGLM